MLRYTLPKSTTFTHRSGAAFTFLLTEILREEYRTILAAKVPSEAVKIDKSTNTSTLVFDLLPPALQYQMNNDDIYFPAYCLQCSQGIVDETGSDINAGDLKPDQRADLLLFACSSDPDFRPWLRKLLMEPEKKATAMDSGEQLVVSKDLPGLSPPPESA